MGLFPDKKNPIHKMQKMMGGKSKNESSAPTLAAGQAAPTKASGKAPKEPALTPEQIKELNERGFELDCPPSGLACELVKQRRGALQGDPDN